jgi:hypothetical protein
VNRSFSTSIPFGIAVEKFAFVFLIALATIAFNGKKYFAVRSIYLITLRKFAVQSRSISKVSKGSQ